MYVSQSMGFAFWQAKMIACKIISFVHMKGTKIYVLKQTLFMIPHSTDNANILQIKIQTFRSQGTFVSVKINY